MYGLGFIKLPYVFMVKSSRLLDRFPSDCWESHRPGGQLNRCEEGICFPFVLLVEKTHEAHQSPESQESQSYVYQVS